MKRAPIVTVILPVWNRERFIGPCIESILNQTFDRFELLIIDDGSTDHSANLIQSFADHDARIRILQQTNSGCYAARNRALAETHTEYTAIIDSDDVALPTRLEEQVHYLNAHPEHAAVGTWAVFTDPFLVPNQTVHTPTHHDEIDRQHLAGSPGGLIHGTAMCRTDLMREVGGYRAAPNSADYDLFLKLAEVGHLANLPRVLQKIRTHRQSISYSSRADQIARARQYAQEARARRGVESAVPTPPHSPTINSDAIVSAVDQTRSWALNAIHARCWWAARRHACSLLRLAPLDRDSWRILRWSVTG